MRPSASTVATGRNRAVVIPSLHDPPVAPPTQRNAPVAGFHSSAVASTFPSSSSPPATRTFPASGPVVTSAAACPVRGLRRLGLQAGGSGLTPPTHANDGP